MMNSSDNRAKNSNARSLTAPLPLSAHSTAKVTDPSSSLLLRQQPSAPSQHGRHTKQQSNGPSQRNETAGTAAPQQTKKSSVQPRKKLFFNANSSSGGGGGAKLYSPSFLRNSAHYKALLAESRSKAWGAAYVSLSWVCYGCATMWLGLVILLFACTVMLLWTIRHEALEEFVPVECGVADEAEEGGGTAAHIETQTLATIGFGSCNKHDEPQQFWETVSEVLRRESTLAEHHHLPPPPQYKSDGDDELAATQEYHRTCHRHTVPSVRSGIARPADAFVWLGDVVYLDGNAGRGRSVLEATEIAYSAMDVPIKGYENVSNPYYRSFKQSMSAEVSILAEEAEENKKKASLTGLADLNSLQIRGERDRFLTSKDANDKDGGSEKMTTLASSSSSSFSSALRSVPSRIIGTWDDHDMGINDGGKEFPYHSHTRSRFLDFLSISKDDGLRARDGIYSFHTITASEHEVMFPLYSGESAQPSSSSSFASSATPHVSSNSSSTLDSQKETNSNNKNTVGVYRLSDHYENAFCIILLDVRTHRDPIVLSRRGDMLGEAQWQWFETILKNNVSDDQTHHRDEDNGNARGLGSEGGKGKGRRKCAATIIGSGIQHLSSEKPTEQWWNFKESRQRLWKLLRKYNIGRAALISGDIHLMELVKAEPSFTGLGYPMIDFTSSGLTHQSGKFFDTFTKFRKYLTWMFPMAVTCTPRGLTPVGNDDPEGVKGRRCHSAFDLLPDWIFETIFPAMGWRVGHYLGRNVGAISLQVSVPAANKHDGSSASSSSSAPTTNPSTPLRLQDGFAPELSLRFSGYALSLKDREVFLPWRYESEVDEPQYKGRRQPQRQRLGKDEKTTVDSSEKEKSSSRRHLSLKAHAVTRHDQPLQVIEYVQPLRTLEIDSCSSSNASPQSEKSECGNPHEFDHSNHHWWKTITFASQSFALSLSNNSKVRNLGVVIGFAAYLIPIGIAAVWISSLLVRSCRGFGGRKRRTMGGGGKVNLHKRLEKEKM